MDESPKSRAPCPMCGASTRSHTRIARRPPGVQDSVSASDKLMDTVACFLNLNMGHPYCRLCLVRVLRADRYTVTRTLTILSINPDYCVERRICAGCRMPRMTIWLKRRHGDGRSRPISGADTAGAEA
jgi:hypothetical protein